MGRMRRRDRFLFVNFFWINVLANVLLRLIEYPIRCLYIYKPLRYKFTVTNTFNIKTKKQSVLSFNHSTSLDERKMSLFTHMTETMCPDRSRNVSNRPKVTKWLYESTTAVSIFNRRVRFRLIFIGFETKLDACARTRCPLILEVWKTANETNRFDLTGRNYKPR